MPKSKNWQVKALAPTPDICKELNDFQVPQLLNSLSSSSEYEFSGDEDLDFCYEDMNLLKRSNVSRKKAPKKSIILREKVISSAQRLLALFASNSNCAAQSSSAKVVTFDASHKKVVSWDQKLSAPSASTSNSAAQSSSTKVVAFDVSHKKAISSAQKLSALSASTSNSRA